MRSLQRHRLTGKPLTHGCFSYRWLNQVTTPLSHCSDEKHPFMRFESTEISLEINYKIRWKRFLYWPHLLFIQVNIAFQNGVNYDSFADFKSLFFRRFSKYDLSRWFPLFAIISRILRPQKWKLITTKYLHSIRIIMEWGISVEFFIEFYRWCVSIVGGATATSHEKSFRWNKIRPASIFI